MRILLLNYEFPPLGGGASPVSYELAKNYINNGHKVDVVTMGYKNLPSFEKKDGINIYRLKNWRSKKYICHPWEQFTYIISAFIFFKKHLKNKPKNYYSINHCHFIVPTGFIAYWLNKKYKIRYIITAHGSDVLGYNKRFRFIYPLLKKPWRTILADAKVIICPSLYLMNKIKEKGINTKMINIVNGTYVDKFPVVNKKNIILVVARLFPNKGVQDVIRAIELIKVDLEEKKWQVYIIGDGPYKIKLVEMVNEKKLNHIVSFKGWHDNNSNYLRKTYAQSKIFISASYFENMSMVILDALAAKNFVLATDVGGNPEILPKENLFEIGNSQELSNKIIKLIINEKIEQINLDSNFEWKNVSKRYLNIMKEVIN